MKDNQDYFGEKAPKNMPEHLFPYVSDQEFETAEKANISNQNFSVCPRYWYVKSWIRCSKCGVEFTFEIAEQRYWYEELKFWVDSFPDGCLSCRRRLRGIKSARKIFDEEGKAALLKKASLGDKLRVFEALTVVLESSREMSKKLHEAHRILGRQIEVLKNPRA